MTSAPAAVRVLTCLLVFVSVSCVTPHEVRGRGRRADDRDPLEAVVNALSEKVDQLTAQSAAQDAHLASLQSRLDAVEDPVAFTARFSAYDISGLQLTQTLKFDDVLYNAGSGYAPATGLFTAPSAGTYAFFISVMMHSGDTDSLELGLYHGDKQLTRAYACCHQFDEGFATATVQLATGDTVHVKFLSGHDSSLWGDVHTSFTGIKLAP